LNEREAIARDGTKTKTNRRREKTRLTLHTKQQTRQEYKKKTEKERHGERNKL